MIQDDAYALYEANGQHMHKYVKWGTNTCKVSFSNTLRPYPVSVERDVSTPIPSMLEEPPTDLRAGQSSAEISGATEERLKELGYL